MDGTLRLPVTVLAARSRARVDVRLRFDVRGSGFSLARRLREVHPLRRMRHLALGRGWPRQVVPGERHGVLPRGELELEHDEASVAEGGFACG